LAKLAGHTKLRELNVGSMAHDIGVPELEWMVQHWSRLNKVLRYLYESAKPDDQWLWDHPAKRIAARGKK